MTVLSMLGEAAIEYARRGWRVFPCTLHGKAPLTDHGLKDASTNEPMVREWWTNYDEANIGHPTGEHIVLDVDGPEGEAALAALERQHGPLPATLSVSTGRGRHLYFAQNGTRLRNSAAKLGPQLDIRGEGGYVIIPPSIHWSGKQYEWVDPGIKISPLPAWIAAALAEPEQSPPSDSEAGEKVTEGKRNTYLTRLAGRMRWTGMTQDEIEAALLKVNQERCEPPLADSEVKRIAESVAQYPAAGKTGRHAGVPGVLASDVKPQSVTWLWPNYIPLGKVTLFDGDPDLAKSTVSLDLAARVTSGLSMPDGATCGCQHAGAVIVSLEDGVEDTIQPRLVAAGAALEKVRIVQAIAGGDGTERTPTLPIDLPAIELAINDVNAKLLVLDPLAALLGAETNSHRDQDIRRVLAPVAALAQKTGVAIVCIRHLNKSGGQNAKYRGGGSIGIIGAARAAFLFAGKPGETDQYVFAPIKNNLSRGKPAALEYSVKDKNGQPVIDWHGESFHTADSLLAQPQDAEESNALSDARNFLSELLKDGPQDAREVFSEAREARVSRRTLQRAKADLGIVSKKEGIGPGQHWEWALPNMAKQPPKITNDGNLATFDQVIDAKPDTSASSPKIANNESLAGFGHEDENLDSQPVDEIQR